MSSGRSDLILVARRLGPLAARGAFVGGATLELLISDKGAGPIRPTDDVDVVLPVATRREFSEMRLLLDRRDFLESFEGHLPADRASQARLPGLLAKLEALSLCTSW